MDLERLRARKTGRAERLEESRGPGVTKRQKKLRESGRVRGPVSLGELNV